MIQKSMACTPSIIVGGSTILEKILILIWEGVLLWGVNFSRGDSEFFGKMKKMHNHSIENSYSNML